MTPTSLFKAQVLNSDGDPMTLDDHMASGREAASRPQTFHGQVPLATVAPPLPPSTNKPVATRGHVAPPLSPERLFSPPAPLDSSAESGWHQQPAAHAEMEDMSTKRAFVPPMTPKPLLIRGTTLK